MKARVILNLYLLALLTFPAVAETNSTAAQLVNEAMALTPDPESGAALYGRQCADCHGARAWGDGAKGIPVLAGQREDYLVTQLADFATLDRIAPEMHRVLQQPELRRPQVLRDLAAYLGRQAQDPQPEHGDGRALQVGESLYVRACAQCHGQKAEGSAEEPIPALRGQHYSYLVVQLQNFAAGHRSNVEPPVIDFAAGLSPEEIEGVADYLSRQADSPPK